jgi:hypothetical protein
MIYCCRKHFPIAVKNSPKGTGIMLDERYPKTCEFCKKGDETP